MNIFTKFLNLVFHALLVISTVFYDPIFSQLKEEAKGLYMLALLVAVAIHAPSYFGSWRKLMLFLLVCFLVPTAIEEISVRTGFPFGYFEHKLGREQYGHIKTFFFLADPKIPVMVSLFWLTYIYPQYIMTMSIFYGSTTASCTSYSHIIPVSFITSLFYTGLDIVIDPFYLAKGHFVYFNVDPKYNLYGVPLSNFIGWIITVTVVLTIYHTLEMITRKKSSVAIVQPTSSNAPVWYVILPILLQGSRALYFGANHNEFIMKLLSFYLILLPVVLSTAQLLFKSKVKIE